jgi:pyruvate kinase
VSSPLISLIGELRSIYERAECVMVNKGPYIREAVVTLDGILRRMQAHQTKKRALLRPLQIADAVLAELSAPTTIT